jgi:two-component system, NarL family, response regulator NreC
VYSVLLVASVRLVREGMRALIERDKNFKVIGETDDRSHTVRLLGTFRPDVILFDLDPDHAAGIETITGIVGNNPGIRIIALSTRCEYAIVEGAVRAGVRGFICKAGPSDDLADILKTVAQGGAYLSTRLVGQLMDRLKKGELRSTPNPALEGLTEREVQVLRLLAEGLATKEVAATLDLAVETVRTYRKTLMKKLKVHNVAELVQFAASAGVIVVTGMKDRGDGHASPQPSDRAGKLPKEDCLCGS